MWNCQLISYSNLIGYFTNFLSSSVLHALKDKNCLLVFFCLNILEAMQAKSSKSYRIFYGPLEFLSVELNCLLCRLGAEMHYATFARLRQLP